MTRTSLAFLAQLAGCTVLVLGVFLVFGLGVACIVAGLILLGLGR